MNSFNDLEKTPLAVVISDVHLQDRNDALAEKIISLFSDVKELRPKYFLLLGDIFDFCFGGGSYFKKKYDWFYQELVEIQSLGVQVCFVEGNHEFAMERMGWNKIQILQTAKKKPIIVLTGTSIAISHGDFFAAPWKYLMFRSLVKSKLLHHACSMLPGKALELYAKTHSSYSREKSESRELKHQEILSSAFQMVQNHCPSVKILLFGHFHYPFEKTIDQRRLLSMHSWHKPNALCIYDNHDYKRVYL